MSKRTMLLMLSVIGALVFGWQVAAFAAHPEASLPFSNFEIDTDANLKVDDASPSVDWASLANTTNNVDQEIRVPDKVNGTGDNSYDGGVKEDTVCPTQKTDSVPPNKSDLLSFHVNKEPGNANNAAGYLNLAWSRVSEPSGTTLMDFEFNANSPTVTGACGGDSPNVKRSQGDVLIEYAIDQGGSRADITARRWNGNATSGSWGPTEDLDAPSPLCPDNNTSNDLNGVNRGPCAAGTINQTAILFGDSDGLITSGQKNPFTFGEAQVDLRYIFQSGKCQTLGSAMLKSRSSDSFTSQLKDFVSPAGINISNCAKVIFHKETVPDETDQNFLYTHDLKTDPALTNDQSTTFDDTVKFQLNDKTADTKTYNNVLLNTAADPTYVVSEDTLPASWKFDSLVCGDTSAAGAAANPLHTGVTTTIDPATRKVTFSLDSASDVAECTFTNSQLTTTLGTAQSFIPQDTATVGGLPNSGFDGTVDFRLYSGLDCGGTTPPAPLYEELNVPLTGTTTKTATTNNDGVPAATDGDAGYTIAGTGGDFSWKVKYEGDGAADGAQHPDQETCVEESRVTIDNDDTVAPNPLAAVIP